MTSPEPLPKGVRSQTVSTGRLETHYLESGKADGTPLVLLHGNCSSSRFWGELMGDLPDEYRVLAPDLRGYGDTADEPVDATDGLGDFAADVHALLVELGVDETVSMVGWSNGGGVTLRSVRERPADVSAAVLVNPVSPYGFGGTVDVEGTPAYEDYAGSGGGAVNESFIDALAAGDRSTESDTSPRAILRSFYVDPSTELDPALEEAYLDSILSTAIGEENYPGDVTESGNWPGIGPGERGVNNAISPKYLDNSDIVDVSPKPPIHWLRGENDSIVSNESFFDLGYLGQIGEVPGWPGEDVFAPQPMVDQTRRVLEDYADAGGDIDESVYEGVGHSPHIEAPERFRKELLSVLAD